MVLGRFGTPWVTWRIQGGILFNFLTALGALLAALFARPKTPARLRKRCPSLAAQGLSQHLFARRNYKRKHGTTLTQPPLGQLLRGQRWDNP